MFRRAIMLLGIIALVGWVVLPAQAAVVAATRRDVLIYSVYYPEANNSILYRYDQVTKTKTVVRTSVSHFAMNMHGHLAFYDPHKKRLEVIDISTENIRLVSFIFEAGVINSPLSWSMDGRYLAYIGKASRLMVWDWSKSIDITPELQDDSDKKGYFDGLQWSADGRLAFRVVYDVIDENNCLCTKKALYVWEGKNTVDLSQNGNADNGYPVWSADGRLAFVGEQGGVHNLYVWDGVSYKDGLPDKSKYANIAPNLTGYYSYPDWTHEGLLVFTGSGMFDKYIWDGDTVIGRDWDFKLRKLTAAYAPDGRYTYMLKFLSKWHIFVRSADNTPLLFVKGDYPPVWNRTGQIMFCRYSSPNWQLMIWDGNQVMVETIGVHIYAQWQSGGTTLCSSG